MHVPTIGRDFHVRVKPGIQPIGILTRKVVCYRVADRLRKKTGTSQTTRWREDRGCPRSGGDSGFIVRAVSIPWPGAGFEKGT